MITLLDMITYIKKFTPKRNECTAIPLESTIKATFFKLDSCSDFAHKLASCGSIIDPLYQNKRHARHLPFCNKVAVRQKTRFSLRTMISKGNLNSLSRAHVAPLNLFMELALKYNCVLCVRLLLLP